MISVGIIGPGRTQQGTGEYIVNYLLEEEVFICGVVASSLISASKTVKKYHQLYGVDTIAFSDVTSLIENEKPEAIFICTPALLHETDIHICLENKIHVFCEKPLIWREEGLYLEVQKLLNSFQSKHLLLHQNTQWLFALPDFKKMIENEDFQKIEAVRIEFASKVFDFGIIIRETIPHANSIILGLGLTDNYEKFTISVDTTRQYLELSFSHIDNGNNKTVITYGISTYFTQPRPMAIVINGRRIERKIDMNGYKTYLTVGKNNVLITDPLKRSVHYFLEKIKKADTTMSESEQKIILKNFELIDIFKKQLNL